MFTVPLPFFLLLADSNSELCFTLFRAFYADTEMVGSCRELTKETIYLLKIFSSLNLGPRKIRNI